jgi:hypothetical protein
MLPIFWLGAGGLALGLLHGLRPLKPILLATVACLLVIGALGLFGTLSGRKRLEEAVRIAEPTLRPALLAQGNLEAARPLQLAAIVTAAAALPLFVGELRRWQQRVEGRAR